MPGLSFFHVCWVRGNDGDFEKGNNDAVEMFHQWVNFIFTLGLFGYLDENVGKECV